MFFDIQVFVIRQVCEKHLANRKYVFWASKDYEKAYDTIDRHGMYVADAKSVWSWRKIDESSAEFLCR